MKFTEFVYKCFTYDRIKHFRIALGLGSFYKFIYSRDISKKVKIQSKTESYDTKDAKDLKKRITKIFN